MRISKKCGLAEINIQLKIDFIRNNYLAKIKAILIFMI